MATNAQSVVNVDSAYRGASGATEITTVRQMAHSTPGAGRTIHGKHMPKLYKRTYGEPVVALRVTSVHEKDSHDVQAEEEVLVVKYYDDDSLRTRTYARVAAMPSGGETLFPGPEEDGPANVHEIQFKILEANPGEGLATAWTDVAST